MERRKFVKKISAFTTGSLILSGSNLYALDTDKKIKNNAIDLSPLTIVNKKIIVKGNFIDSETLEPIESVKMKAKVRKNRLFPLSQSIESTDGSYIIETGFTSNVNKANEKVIIEITAHGYKPFTGNLYLTESGSNVHSEMWDYNPQFKAEYCPKNDTDGNRTVSMFNFHLVKA